MQDPKKYFFFLFHLLSVSWFIPFQYLLNCTQWAPRGIGSDQECRHGRGYAAGAEPSNDWLLHHQLTTVLIGKGLLCFLLLVVGFLKKTTRDMCRWLLCLVLDEEKDGCYVGRMPSILQLKPWRSTTLRVSNKLVSGQEGYPV